MNVAKVTIPENIVGTEVFSNGVHPVVLINTFNYLIQYYAVLLVEMAKKEVGDNPELQAQYIDRLTKQYLGNNPSDKLIDPNRMN